MAKAISTKLAPAAVGPYSQGVEAAGTIYVSGQLPIDPQTKIMPEGVAEQAARALDNIAAILSEAGCTMDNVVKTTVLLADMNDFAQVNEVYATYFPGLKPARACYQVARLPMDARLEIEAIAVR